MKRLKELEHENSWLKRMYADLPLENAALKDVISSKLSRLLSAREIAQHLATEHDLATYYRPLVE